MARVRCGVISAATVGWGESIGGCGDGSEAWFGIAGNGADGAVAGFGHDHGGIDAGFTELGCCTVT
jgi:hypothetical protein